MADQDKPTPHAIDLDKLEREGSIDPFVFKLDGKRITMLDAQELDWQDLLLASQNPRLLMRHILPENAQEQFFKAKIEAWKLNALMNKYFEHYGIDPELLAASQR